MQELLQRKSKDSWVAMRPEATTEAHSGQVQNVCGGPSLRGPSKTLALYPGLREITGARGPECQRRDSVF